MAHLLFNEKLGAIIYHIVARLGRVEGRTRLMKLVYLADVKAAQELGHTMSGAQFYSYTHGPFAREVLDAIREMRGFWIEEGEVLDANGETAYVYTLSRFPAPPLVLHDSREKEIVNQVVERWGRKRLRDILNFVYTNEPFASTPLGQMIDFNRVPMSRSASTEPASTPINAYTYLV